MVRLHASGQMVGDGRIVTDHFQDHGLRWSLANGFHAARSSYGYARSWMSGRDRRRAALAVVPNIMVGFVREAWQGRRGQRGSLAEIVAVVPIAFATGLGGAIGALLGPGRSPEQIA